MSERNAWGGNPSSGKRAGFDGKPESPSAFASAVEGVEELEASAHLQEVAGWEKAVGDRNSR